jgi:hypothetical protein
VSVNGQHSALPIQRFEAFYDYEDMPLWEALCDVIDQRLPLRDEPKLVERVRNLPADERQELYADVRAGLDHEDEPILEKIIAEIEEGWPS